jgi:hypothetical protein
MSGAFISAFPVTAGANQRWKYSSIISGAAEMKKINETGLAHVAFPVADVPKMLKKVFDHGGSQLGKIVAKDIT